ncbi:MAG: hypothetical protein B9S32_00915 [Verrucomicrobia bacterium Tous-C9LFEB]|nr:MAG: hypothetical protein B9S32_00915 [Verrucomicrobia bacterium Tous-C9LFEB]
MSGNAASTGALSLAPLSNGSYSRAASRSFTSATTQSTLWFSTLLQADANTLNSANGATAMIGFTTGALPTTAASSTTGATWTTANGGALGGFAWGLSNGNLSVAYQSDILGAGAVTLANTGYSITAGTTYLLLGKLIVDASGNDVLNIWALTSPVSSEAELGAATWSVSSADLLASSGLNTLLVYAGSISATGTPTDTTLFDAIAVGTSFPDLNVVPEPSVNAALFLSVVILSWRAIRRRNDFQPRRGGHA